VNSTLTIGELFPSDDLVGHWVFTLAATTADLSAVDEVAARFQNEHKHAEHLYFYRLLIARLYEARRAVLPIDQHSQIAKFLAEIPEATEPIEFLRDHYLPVDDSKISQLYGLHRHRTIHHAFVGSQELEETLAVAGDEVARMVADHEDRRLYLEFPEAAIMRYLYPDLSRNRSELLDQHAELSRGIRKRFAMLVAVVMPSYLDRRQIDYDRLLVRFPQ